MLIGGLQKFTLLDFPGKLAATVFTYGCNMRCPYCHNASLVVGSPGKLEMYTTEEVLAFLKKRQGKLDGLAITGGEPLMHQDLRDFLIAVRALGFLIKIDTNGSFPERIAALNKEKLIDYWAMDVKVPFEGLKHTVEFSGNPKDIEASIKALIDGPVDYEFRITVVRGIHSEGVIKQLGNMINGARRVFIQNFRSAETIDPGLGDDNSFTNIELESFQSILKKYVKEVGIR